MYMTGRSVINDMRAKNLLPKDFAEFIWKTEKPTTPSPRPQDSATVGKPGKPRKRNSPGNATAQSPFKKPQCSSPHQKPAFSGVGLPAQQPLFPPQNCAMSNAFFMQNQPVSNLVQGSLPFWAPTQAQHGVIPRDELEYVSDRKPDMLALGTDPALYGPSHWLPLQNASMGFPPHAIDGTASRGPIRQQSPIQFPPEQGYSAQGFQWDSQFRSLPRF
jgi:hypothetical protein